VWGAIARVDESAPEDALRWLSDNVFVGPTP
jgi:hypothetical protein